MARARTQEVETQRQTAGNALTDTRSDNWKPGVDGIVLSYLKLPQETITLDHRKHFKATSDALWDAFDAYDADVQKAQTPSGSRIESRHTLHKAIDRFSGVVERSRSLPYPPEILERLSLSFLSVALDAERDIPQYARHAMAEMGAAIGGNAILPTKVRHIAKQHLDTLVASQKGQLTESQATVASLAERILDDFGVEIAVEDIPSLTDDMSAYAEQLAQTTRSGAQKVAKVGIAATVSAAILAAPTLAHAKENTSSTPVAVAAGATTQAPENTIIAVGTTVQAAVETGKVSVTVGVAGDKIEVPNTILSTNVSPSAAVDVAKQSVHVAVPEGKVSENTVISTVLETTPKTTTLKAHVGVDADAKAPTNTVISTTTVTQEVKKNLPVKSVDLPATSLDEDGNPVSVEPTEIEVKTVNKAPRLDPETATQEQLLLEKITDAVVGDGEVEKGSALIRIFFHDKTLGEASPDDEATNGKFADNITSLSVGYKDLIAKRGHADVNYINNTLTALAVLDAAGHDQSILNSPDIQGLIGGIKRPDDAYQAKLFDQYLGKAKEALGANNGELMAGFGDAYKAQLETMYTYVLMANSSDEQQGKEIQAIKDAEAAEAARIAAEQAARNAGGPVESQAIQNLIDREGDPAKKRAFQAMQFLMANAGINATQAAGILGNLDAESAGTFDPAIKQFGGGPGRGIAQWEGGRWISLQNFAAQRGTGWDNLDTQLAFMLSELPGRRDTLNVIKGTGNLFDAAKEFMVRFETPRVVVDALNGRGWGPANAQAQHRADRGQWFLDAFNNEVNAVNAAREAAAKAEAERQAKMGMTFDQAVAFMQNYKNSPESVKFIGNAGTGCDGGPLSNCVSFSLYFINKYTNVDATYGYPGNGSTVVRNLKGHHGEIETGSTARVNAVFSTASGAQWCGDVKCGHTGVVLGIDEANNKIIIGEAACNAAGPEWDTAHTYPLDKFNNGQYTYAYLNDRLDTALQ